MNAAKTKIVLMAEDDADDRLLAKDAMAESGASVEMRFIENGAELMDYLLRRNQFADPASSPRPDLVLLDLNMPKKDGREVLAEIKTNKELRQIPVVVLTTSTAETDLRASYYLGANSYVVKPASYDALVKMMGALSNYWMNIVRLP